VLNSDAEIYGGSGVGNMGRVQASEAPAQGQAASATITIPPLATVMLRFDSA
jgi:1,4-alpha-glucan branching enzyme